MVVCDGYDRDLAAPAEFGLDGCDRRLGLHMTHDPDCLHWDICSLLDLFQLDAADQSASFNQQLGADRVFGWHEAAGSGTGDGTQI